MSQLRASTILAEDLSLGSSTDVGWLTTTFNSSFRGSSARAGVEVRGQSPFTAWVLWLKLGLSSATGSAFTGESLR